MCCGAFVRMRVLERTICGEARVVEAVIDKRYSLSEVSDALRHLEGGHAQGIVAITGVHNSN